ncbi:zinc finger protein 576, tandem duplicate 1 [Polymixia lowei]
MRQVDKEVPDGRKYIPRKKGMLDPLKMDMSKPVVMPLTSSQLSLQCIECHIIFSDHKSKERHLKLSHPAEYEQCILRNALFACYVCDRHFTNSTELMVHQKAHIERKPFKCPICGQAFNKSSELTLHKKIHFGRDGYACSDCGKPCKTLTLLKYHRRTHTGERPYVCKECGKRFSMSKALQKHMVSHFPEGVEEDGGNALGTAKTQPKKPNSTPTIKYPCSVCKATFKSTKTRLHHMKNKHNLLPAATSNALPAGQQVRLGAPIITPISICQPTLLHVEPIGPLQQVDANIDTEQIRKLIESLGNVQKVNQVVILGQVPPNAPPLDLQQIQALGEPINLNLAPPPIELLELKQTEQSKTMEVEHAKNQCDLMEQTIILEPITPDGQLENPSFPELVSHIAPPENIGLTLVEPEQIERPEGKMIHQLLQQTETIAIQSIPLDQTVCQSESQTNPEREADSQIQTVRLDQVHSVLETMSVEETHEETVSVEETPEETVSVEETREETVSVEETHEKIEQEPSENALVDSRECQEKLGKPCTSEDTTTQEQIPAQLETKKIQQGHKQPQLKVYKLDPSKAPGQTQESSCQDSPKTCQSKDATLKQRKDMSEPPNMLTAGSKKKGGRPKKNQRALSLLSSVLVSRPQPEALPTRPKTTRKRKASLKVETEGVITSSHSKRALECKDCGERFSGVSSLQEHKATAHIVESPGLTYTNGNIFEGVSRLDLCHPPKMTTEVIGVMNPATDWDTEAEMGDMALDEREGRVSFPALNPSPSLPVAAADVDDTGLEEKNENTVMGDITAFIGIAKKPSEQPCHTPPEVLSPCCSKSDQMKTLGSNSESSCFTSVTPSNSSPQTRDSEAGGPAASDEAKPTCQVSGEDIPRSPLLHSSESEVQGTTDEDIKEGLLLEVDLVTVGEQNESDNATLASESGTQNEVVGPCSPESNSTNTLIPTAQIDKTTEISQNLQTASHSTQPQEFKDEEEEILVQRKEEGVRGAGRRRGTRGRRGGRGGRGRLKRGVICDREAEKESDECQVIFQKYLLTADSEINSEDKTSTVPNAQSTSREQLEISSGFEPSKGMPPATSVPSSLEESPEEQAVFEMESEAELRREGVEEQDRESGQSSGVILERFLASRQTEAGDEDQSQMPTRIGQRQGSDGIAENEVIFREVEGGQEIKVEENISDPPPVAQTSESRQRMDTQPQHQRGVRIVLVKQESSLILNDPQATLGSRHIRWNVERMDIETPPVTEVGAGTRASSVAPDFNSKHCIFYPVKEEEREVLVGATHRDNNVLTLGESSDARLGQKTECQPASSCLYEESPDAEDYQEIRVRELQLGTEINDFENTGENIEQRDTPELRDFLLQSSDEEDSDVYEFSDPQPDSEAQAMANFYRNQNSSPPEPNEISQNLPTSESQPHSHSLREGSGSREPIYYFCKYFGWDTWAEIAQCTNKLSNIPNPVTPKEIAQYVGIHIAMGTLKFPSLKLYWQDLTKVPLIAEAMPLSRFLQLSRKLKLAFPDKEPIAKCREERHERDIQNVQPVTATSSATSSCNMSSYGQIPLLGNGQSHGENTNDCLNIQTDPLWRVQPLLRRFQAGCLLLRQEGNYGVDQYPLPLTTVKVNNNNRSLHCTTLIGFGGLILHFDLKLDRSDKEAAVEKIVPRDSMVFLCKQELSTPAMLERLLIAGVHGVGRVGGATGQIGDEFVSSDGRLMLRRSHCGFILSTVENGQRNMASLINNFEKAQTSARLNRDLRNLYRIPLTALVPTCWPQAVLWCLTDLALVNSWLLYRQDHRTESELLTLMAFRLEVAKTLILSSGSDTQDSIAPQPNTQKAHASSVIPNPDLLQESPLPEASIRYDGSGHWPEQLEAGEGGRCRFGGCERTSRVLCLKCCVFLCISRNHNCFLNFHNQGRL